MEKDEVKKYLFWAMIFGIIAISYLLLKDFLVSILSAFVLAYALKPLNDKISKKVPKKIAAFITVATSIIVILGIITLVLTSLANQIINIAKENNTAQLLSLFTDTKYYDIIANNVNLIITKLGEFAFSLLSSTLSQVPSLALNLLIVFFTTYYLLIEWEQIRERIIKIIPFENKRKMVEKIEKTTHEILLGTLFIAVLETIIAIIGFWLLGIKFYLVLGFLMGILAIIPALGPSIVWVPLAIFLLLTKSYPTAIGVIILGLIIGLGIDYWLRIRILGRRTEMHPLIMLFGLLGGIKLFGIMGFVIGPLILSILVTIIENMPSSQEKESKEKKK